MVLFGLYNAQFARELRDVLNRWGFKVPPIEQLRSITVYVPSVEAPTVTLELTGIVPNDPASSGE